MAGKTTAISRPATVSVEPCRLPGRIGVTNQSGKVWIKFEVEGRYQPFELVGVSTPMEALKIARLLARHARQAVEEVHGR